MAAHNNLINGEWVAGASDTPNVNPSNVKDIVGEYAQADAAARGRCPTSSSRSGIPASVFNLVMG